MMDVSDGVILMLLGVAVVLLTVRVVSWAYRDKQEVWRSQAFLTGPQPASRRRTGRQAVRGGTVSPGGAAGSGSTEDESQPQPLLRDRVTTAVIHDDSAGVRWSTG